MGDCWTFFDYMSDGGRGRNKIREWLNGLPCEAQAAIDYRLRTMEGAEKWPTKWTKKYQGLDDIFEIRITHNKVQYRPLCTRIGDKKTLILIGAIEKNWKIPKGDLISAKQRLADWKKDSNHAKFHIFDSEKNLEVISK